MKKTRFLSLFLALAIAVSLLITTASASGSQILDDMEVKAEAAILVNGNTDTILYNQNGDAKVYPASITKVMTALLVAKAIERGDLSLEDKIIADDHTWDGLDTESSNQNIQPGEEMTVDELMQCMLIASAGEASNVLAIAVSGSIDTFVEQMNSEAVALGCTGTHFVNPSGMPDDDHYSTCYDLYLMAKAAMQYDLIRQLVSEAEAYIDATNLSPQRHFFNTNALLSNFKYYGYVYDKCIGIKTGSTEAAGYCLLSAAQDNDKTLYAVVMGCQNTEKSGLLQFSESSRLLEWGFDNFAEVQILDSATPQGEIPVTLSEDTDHVTVTADQSITAELPKDVTAESFTPMLHLPETLEAPISKGDVLGTMTLMFGDEEYTTVNLIATSDVELSPMLVRKAQIQALLSTTWFKIVLVVVAALLLLLLIKLIVTILGGGRGNRYGSYSGSRGGGGYRGGRRRH